ncbi:MAG: hypothetical protein QRY72_04540 [Candidatus Rhabdochlamydia sp.]
MIGFLFFVIPSGYSHAFTLQKPFEPRSCSLRRDPLLEASLTHYGLELKTPVNLTPYFHHQVMIKKQDDNTFTFSVEWKPQSDVSNYFLAHTFIFVLDPCYLTSLVTYEPFKKGLIQAISLLDHHHTFNIAILGDLEFSLGKEGLIASAENKAKAVKFLNALGHKHHQKIKQGVKALDSLIMACSQTQPATVVLISDGASLHISSTDNHPSSFSSLELLSAGKKRDQQQLETFAKCAHARYTHSKTYTSFSSHLQQVVKELQTCIAHELKAWVITPQGILQLTEGVLPDLFAQKGFKIEGHSLLSPDFTLVIEGKNNDQTVFFQEKVLHTSSSS